MKKLEDLLKKMEGFVPQFKYQNFEVSNASIGWQLEHIMLVINNVIIAIEVSNPQDYRGKWNLSRAVVMTKGSIPRGKAKAPHRVQPADEYDEATLSAHLSQTRQHLNKLKNLNKDLFFDHPIFGHMKLKSAVKFLEIHTNHHLSIVKDILR